VTPSADEVLGVLRDAVVTVMEVEPGTVTRATRFLEDLRADSLALVEIVEIVEERLALSTPTFRIDDADIDDITTVGEAVDYALGRL
jgi:acyl carrier protein